MHELMVTSVDGCTNAIACGLGKSKNIPRIALMRNQGIMQSYMRPGKFEFNYY